jgi:RNA polymerase-binding protein DksA
MKAQATKAEPSKAAQAKAAQAKAEPAKAEQAKAAQPTKAVKAASKTAAEPKVATKAAKTAASKTAASKTAAGATTGTSRAPRTTGTTAPGRGSRAVPQIDDRAPTTAAPGAAEGATMAKPVDIEATASGTTTATRVPAAKQGGRTATKAAPRTQRSAAETETIRVALNERLTELREEYDVTMTEITELQRDRLTDSAGDDQADTGTKTFEREQEMTLAANLLERVTQVERALERLEEGGYGWCERCGNPIPVERLAAFPSATLCVTCKQLEERR